MHLVIIQVTVFFKIPIKISPTQFLLEELGLLCALIILLLYLMYIVCLVETGMNKFYAQLKVS